MTKNKISFKKSSLIIILFIILLSILTQTYAINNSAYTVINSQTLLESNALDTLVLNYTSLPSVTVSGSETYDIFDTDSDSDTPLRKVVFTNSTAGKILDSVITAKFSNCGKLNGKSIDMKLIYSDIVTKTNTSNSCMPCLVWSAYGNTMASTNEWWYRDMEHTTVKIYFYYSGSNTPITLNTAYLSLFSEDKDEGASSKKSSNQYLYSETYMEYLPSISSKNVSRTYNNVFCGTSNDGR